MTDDHVYGFDRPDAMEILQRHRQQAPFQPLPPPQWATYIVKTPSGGIAARSGTTVTFVDCDVYYLSGTTLTSAGTTVSVGNMSTTAVAGLVYAMTFWAGGRLMAAWEDC